MLNPLLVLSLGKPDGLLQALQGLRSVRNSINVIEIAPDTEARKVPISVAAAVAAHALADTSWSVETPSASSRHGEEDTLPAADEGANAPLRLDSVEFNLDYIQADSSNGQSHRSLSATGAVNSAPGSAAGGSDAESPAHVDTVAAGSVSGMSFAAQPELTALSAAPASQPSATSASDPAVLAVSGSQSPDAHADATDVTLAPVAPGPEETRDPAMIPPDGTDADSHTAKPAEGAPDGPADQSHTDQGKAGQSQADQSSAEPTQASDKGDPVSGPESSGADPKATGPDDQDTGHGGSSFDEPGADVVYAPTGGFTPEHDVSYPLPAAATEVDALGGMLHMSMAGEVVDLEAIFAHHAAHLTEASDPFDPLLVRPPGPIVHDDHQVHSTPAQDVDLGHPGLPGADQDSHQEKPAIPVHDLDV